MYPIAYFSAFGKLLFRLMEYRLYPGILVMWPLLLIGDHMIDQWLLFYSYVKMMNHCICIFTILPTL